MNKTASGRDIVLFVVILFISATIFFTLRYATDNTVSEFTDKTPDIHNESDYNVTKLIEDSTTKTNNMLDYLVLGIFIALVLGIFLTGWLIGGHTIFMILYILFIIIAVTMSIILANAWDDLVNMPIFGGTINSFPIADHLVSYLPYYTVIIGVIGMILMFGKPEE